LPNMHNYLEYMLIFVKKEEFFMKNLLNILSKVSVGLLTMVIFSLANSSSCFCFYQPKEPKSIDDFKWIK
jgi:cyclic lactone autoinducer peptide